MKILVVYSSRFNELKDFIPEVGGWGVSSNNYNSFDTIMRRIEYAHVIRPVMVILEVEKVRTKKGVGYKIIDPGYEEHIGKVIFYTMGNLIMEVDNYPGDIEALPLLLKMAL
ncbi:MAG: hypothetical protein KC414_13990 [Romboutsia sp.]|nr:hypothetical protein [Romboutsia sp.]